MPPVLFDGGPSEFAGLLTKCLLLFGPGEFHVVSSVMPWARSRGFLGRRTTGVVVRSFGLYRRVVPASERANRLYEGSQRAR